MAVRPSYELTLKVNFEGELPDAILKLLSESQRKKTRAAAPAASKAPKTPAATDNYEVLMDSDSSDEDVEMDDASIESEEETASIIQARAYWDSRKDANESIGVDGVKIKKEPSTGRSAPLRTSNAHNVISTNQDDTATSTKNGENAMFNPFSVRNVDAAENKGTSSHAESQLEKTRTNVIDNITGMLSDIGNRNKDIPGDIRDRTFNASEYGANAICRQSSAGHWIELLDPKKLDQSQIMAGSVVIAVDGVFRKGKKGTVSAVFYHPSNDQNQSDFVPGAVQSIERAKLYAVDRALVGARQIQAQPAANLRHVVIKTHEPNLVKWVAKKGPPPTKNADLLSAIDQSISSLNSMSVRVQFWLVKPEQNQWAYCLAHRKLHENGAAQKVMKRWPKHFTKDWID